ncbi:hypothetical protein Tco_0925805 [Tanacetum coccineum]|uniref:Uncharacterized protein n=1 Tax=Tanacetum coccineum TaxID=301880 RepID=A0ABQ5DAW8_9ASTR
MNDIMNPRRRGDRKGRRSKGERTLFAEPIMWDIGDEEEEYTFIDNYQNFQEEENNVSFSDVVLGVEEESMPVYDTDIEDVIEQEEGFVGK